MCGPNEVRAMATINPLLPRYVARQLANCVRLCGSVGASIGGTRFLSPENETFLLVCLGEAEPLTGPTHMAHSEKTTTMNGNTGPRKHSGIFVPHVRVSLATHQGANGRGITPISRIGGQRLTRRNKPKVRPGTNKPGRFIAVVDAVARPSFLPGGFGFDHSIDYEAIPMTPSSNLGNAPKSTTTLIEIQTTVGNLLSEVLAVTALLRLSRSCLQDITVHDPDGSGVGADDLLHANVIALEKLGIIVDLVEQVESVIDTFGVEHQQVSNKDTVGVGHE